MLNYQTHNDLPSNAKAVSIAILNARLADAIDLALLTKQAHWNIKGPNFIALHEMIDGFRTLRINGVARAVVPRAAFLSTVRLVSVVFGIFFSLVVSG
jgi:starvation-inducible DNA-binding protein